MSKKRTYRSVDVQKVEAAAFVALIFTACSAVGVDPVRCIVAIDVAKTKFFAGFATAQGELVRIVRYQHPKQTLAFLSLLRELNAAGANVEVAMEPTGTYGDALCERCEQLGLPVFMVSPKKTHDMAEVVDGVPSQHDAKSTVIIAQLHAMGKSAKRQPKSQVRRTMRALVDQRAIYQGPLEANYGKLEALLARHWPELEQWVELRTQRSWMTLLQRYPGPQAVAAAPCQVADLLRRASRGRCKPETIEGIVLSARTSLGVVMSEQECVLLGALVAEIERFTRQTDAIDKRIAELVRDDEVVQLMAQTVGAVTAAVLIAYVGDPRDYGSASAYEKAFGLNLKVRSSGNHAGQLKITKRGPGAARRILYMAALRLILTDPIAAAWYRNRKSYKADLKKKAVVAVMRKLVRALFHVARGNPFDSSKLFDTRRLCLEQDTDSVLPAPNAKGGCSAERKPTILPRRSHQTQEVSVS